MLCGVPAFYKPSSMDPDAIFRRICSGKIQPRKGIHIGARKIITGLLQKKTAKRLGNLSGGAADVKSSLFFCENGVTAACDWRALVDRSTNGPLKPKLVSSSDTANFDDYSSVPDEHPRAISAAQQSLFECW